MVQTPRPGAPIGYFSIEPYYYVLQRAMTTDTGAERINNSEKINTREIRTWSISSEASDESIVTESRFK